MMNKRLCDRIVMVLSYKNMVQWHFMLANATIPPSPTLGAHLTAASMVTLLF